MSVQTNYNEQPIAQRGVINAAQPSVLTTVIAASDTQFAAGLTRNGTKGLTVTGPLFGITAQNQSAEFSYPTFSADLPYRTGMPMGVLRDGAIWVYNELGTLTAGGTVGCSTAGEFAAVDGTHFLVTNMVVEQTATVGNVALVRILMDRTV